MVMAVAECVANGGGVVEPCVDGGGFGVHGSGVCAMVMGSGLGYGSPSW